MLYEEFDGLFIEAAYQFQEFDLRESRWINASLPVTSAALGNELSKIHRLHELGTVQCGPAHLRDDIRQSIEFVKGSLPLNCSNRISL
jgi:hypothetical protein